MKLKNKNQLKIDFKSKITIKIIMIKFERKT